MLHKLPIQKKCSLGEQENELPNSLKQEPLTDQKKFECQNDHEYCAKGEEFEIQKTIPSPQKYKLGNSCSFCKPTKNFINPYYLMFHLVKHKFCGICTTEFRTANEDWFYEHMLLVHDIKFPYVTFFDHQKSQKLKSTVKSKTKFVQESCSRVLMKKSSTGNNPVFKKDTKTKAIETGIILSIDKMAAVIFVK